jgi:hypothetical protein
MIIDYDDLLCILCTRAKIRSLTANEKRAVLKLSDWSRTATYGLEGL